MKSVVLLGAFLLAALGRSEAAVPPFGTWEWVESETSAGNFVRRSDLSYSIQIAFHLDGIYVEYRNEVIQHINQFEVRDCAFPICNSYDQLWPYADDPAPSAWYYRILEDGLLEIIRSEHPDLWPYERALYAPRNAVVADEATSWGTAKSLWR